MKTFFIILLFFASLIASSQTIVIDKQQNGSTIILYGTNNEYCPVSLQLDLSMQNLNSSAGVQSIILIPEHAQKFKLTELNVIDAKQKWGYTYKTRTMFGNVNLARYDTNYVYDLPYKKGNTFLLFQGYNGAFSHQNENALDFRMPIGTEIVAARSGIVIKVVQNNTIACMQEDCKKYNNYITIYHSDGTLATYAHFQFNGSKVKEGDVIKAGDVIALSGNVGYTSGPHLHFVCFVPGMEKQKSIITKFKTGDGSMVKYLQEKESYSRNY